MGNTTSLIILTADIMFTINDLKSRISDQTEIDRRVHIQEIVKMLLVSAMSGAPRLSDICNTPAR